LGGKKCLSELNPRALSNNGTGVTVNYKRPQQEDVTNLVSGSSRPFRAPEIKETKKAKRLIEVKAGLKQETTFLGKG